MSRLREGWYLMSTSDLERELARFRASDAEVPASNAVPLSISDALAYRAAGNVPDELGRSLRLVLLVEDTEVLAALDDKRLRYEPDYHDAPTWRNKGSRPVNVVPLRSSGVTSATGEAWWEQPELAALEDEWAATGAVAGMKIPAELRGFVYKTVLALRRAGREVGVDAVADSIERWVPPSEADRIRGALHAANP